MRLQIQGGYYTLADFKMFASLIVFLAVSGVSGDCITTNRSLPKPITLISGELTLIVTTNGTYSLQVGSEAPVHGASLSAFVDGKLRTPANGGLVCSPAVCHTGSDKFGEFTAAEIHCTIAASQTPASYSWRAYASTKANTATGGARGRIVMGLTLPKGANGTAAQPNFNVNNNSPIQFAPFPNWKIEGAFASAALLCYGGDKSHLYSLPSLAASSKQRSCFALGNGPATLLWPGNAAPSKFMSAMVGGPASSFHLNYHTVANPRAQPQELEQAELFYNAKRGDVTLCLSKTCKHVQVARFEG